MLFETWPRHEDSPDLMQLGMSVDEMYEGLSSGYFEASLVAGAEVALVGSAWMSAMLLEPPEIELYSPDGSHPSLAGSYLAACVIFGRIAETSCSMTGPPPEGLDPEDAERLQLVADITNNIINPSP